MHHARRVSGGGGGGGSLISKGSAAWQKWDEIKEALGKEKGNGLTASSTSGTASTSKKSKDMPMGPLEPLRKLLKLNHPDALSPAELEMRRLLQLQALSVLVELWRRPMEHAQPLAVIRSESSFWEDLAIAVLLPETTTGGGGATAMVMVNGDGGPSGGGSGEVSGLAWMRHALGVQLLCCELARASRPTTLEPGASKVLAGIMRWLSGSNGEAAAAAATTADGGPGAARLASLMLTAPTLANLSQMHSQIKRMSRPLSTYRSGSSGDAEVATHISAAPFVCARLTLAAPPSQNPLVETCTNVIMSLWVGGARRLLPSTALFDLESLKLRSWRLREAELRSLEASRGLPGGGGYGGDHLHMNTAASAAIAATAEALDIATERAFAGDESAALETSRLLDRLPEKLLSELAPESLARERRAGTYSALALQYQAVAKAAASYNTASLASGGHAFMVHSWRLLLTILSERRQIARPLSPAAPSISEARTPSWLSGVSAQNKLEALLEARVTETAKKQAEWVSECGTARQLSREAAALDAAAVLLREQALALSSLPSALAWQLVEKLLGRPTWQAKIDQLKADANRAAATGAAIAAAGGGAAGTGIPIGPGGPPPQQTPQRGGDRGAFREVSLLAMQTVLDDSKSHGRHYSRTEGAASFEGWQTLHKLTAHVRSDLALGARASALLSSPAAKATITLADKELSDRDAALKAFCLRRPAMGGG